MYYWIIRRCVHQNYVTMFEVILDMKIYLISTYEKLTYLYMYISDQSGIGSVKSFSTELL